MALYLLEVGPKGPQGKPRPLTDLEEAAVAPRWSPDGRWIETDPRVPLGEAEQVRDRLQALGKPLEYVLYRGEGQGIQRFENRLDSARRMTDFFLGHLAGEA